MEFLQDYMMPVVVGICLVVGWIVKHWIKDVDNKWIPTICTVLGAVLGIWVNNWAVTPEAILGGAVSGLASTGLHQLVTQALNKNNTTTSETK